MEGGRAALPLAERVATVVGSRGTPPGHLALMRRINVVLDAGGYVLVSGGATGADSTLDVAENVRVFLPYSGFNGTRGGIVVRGEAARKAEAIAAQVHPAWHAVAPDDRVLHTRNVFQVLGETLDRPSDMLVCWTPRGKVIGGTATALRIAERHDVPIFNIALPDHVAALRRLLGRESAEFDRAFLPEPLVVHRNRVRRGAAYIGRGVYGNGASPYANPFPLRTEDARGSTLVDYASYLLMRRELVERARVDIGGRDLACWCAGTEGLRADDELRCHGQVLLRGMRGDYDRDFDRYAEALSGRGMTTSREMGFDFR